MSQEKSEAATPWDRRNYERLQKKFTVRYRRFEELAGDGSDRTGEVLDMGGGGLCFLASELLADTSQQLMTMAFPGWREDNGDWQATGNEDDIALLTMIGTVLEAKTSVAHPDRFEIRVRFSGRLHPVTGKNPGEEK